VWQLPISHLTIKICLFVICIINKHVASINGHHIAWHRRQERDPVVDPAGLWWLVEAKRILPDIGDTTREVKGYVRDVRGSDTKSSELLED
jgi:hypothetical protein